MLTQFKRRKSYEKKLSKSPCVCVCVYVYVCHRGRDTLSSKRLRSLWTTARRPEAVGVAACWTAAVGPVACWVAVAASGAWARSVPPWTRPTTTVVWTCCPHRLAVRSS